MTSAATSPIPGIGDAIATHRRAANLTQLDLAARIGKSVQWISAVEQGRKHAERLTDLVRIATVLGCTLDDLIGRPVDSLTSGVRRAPQAEAVAAVRAVIMRSAMPGRDAREVPQLDAIGFPLDVNRVRGASSGSITYPKVTWPGSRRSGP